MTFEQYGRVADALIHGRVWVDLPVDPALQAVDNPYDAATRSRLLADGVQLFWDYAYYDGHWYSYFGVLPAVLLCSCPISWPRGGCCRRAWPSWC